MGFFARLVVQAASAPITRALQKFECSYSLIPFPVRLFAPQPNVPSTSSAPVPALGLSPWSKIRVSRFCAENVKRTTAEETSSTLNAVLNEQTEYGDDFEVEVPQEEEEEEEEAEHQRMNYIKLLTIEEVDKVLTDVRAEDVKSINVHKQCEWTDYMVFATGRSNWHVRNIAQALLYKVKQKQKGADRMVLPGIEGREGGKWLVIDTGSIIVHALDENARAYYDLESLWTKERLSKGSNQLQELQNSLKKVRRKRNNKKADV
jgi:ribosome silencing factor RsfS/YbeB/iojap